MGIFLLETKLISSKMISPRIRYAIEQSPILKSVVGITPPDGWNNQTRTFFERVAKGINQVVTEKVINYPVLVTDQLLFGGDEMESILARYRLYEIDDFITHLKNMHYQNPHKWISGKTLQAYWNNGNAKNRKLNVLLTFLGIDFHDWHEWKFIPETNQNGSNELTYGYPNSSTNKLENGSLRVIKKYYTGSYYRYFQKPGNSQTLIKAPFIVKEDKEHVVVIETKTIGHSYKSTYMAIRDGALYLDCENMDWNEKETYIFNIGFEINPKVITGVSNTLNRKAQAIAIKNVLVKQDGCIDYENTDGIEICYDAPLPPESEEAQIISFFKRSGNNIISTFNGNTLEELNNFHLGISI